MIYLLYYVPLISLYDVVRIEVMLCFSSCFLFNALWQSWQILAKERLETTATRRRERLLKREAAQKAAQAEAQQGVEDPRSVADVRQLLEYLQSMNVARPWAPGRCSFGIELYKTSIVEEEVPICTRNAACSSSSGGHCIP